MSREVRAVLERAMTLAKETTLEAFEKTTDDGTAPVWTVIDMHAGMIRALLDNMDGPDPEGE